MAISTSFPKSQPIEVIREDGLSLNPNNSTASKAGKRKKPKKWSLEEDNQLREGVKIHGKKWTKIKKNMPGRNKEQMYNRWTEHLQPGISKEPISILEKQVLFYIASPYENNDTAFPWTKIMNIFNAVIYPDGVKFRTSLFLKNYFPSLNTSKLPPLSPSYITKINQVTEQFKGFSQREMRRRSIWNRREEKILQDQIEKQQNDGKKLGKSQEIDWKSIEVPGRGGPDQCKRHWEYLQSKQKTDKVKNQSNLNKRKSEFQESNQVKKARITQSKELKTPAQKMPHSLIQGDPLPPSSYPPSFPNFSFPFEKDPLPPLFEGIKDLS